MRLTFTKFLLTKEYFTQTTLHTGYTLKKYIFQTLKEILI